MYSLISMLGMRIALRKFIKRLSLTDYKICINCGYNLHGLADDYQCPECGKKYIIGDVIERWKNWADRCLS